MVAGKVGVWFGEKLLFLAGLVFTSGDLGNSEYAKYDETISSSIINNLLFIVVCPQDCSCKSIKYHSCLQVLWM